MWRVVVPRGGEQPPVPEPPAPVHWGYAPPWAPPPPRGPPAKRAMSESDDGDDVFSEESSKDQCSSPGDTDSCQMLSRKKRRGIIEKRRRDRINTSLSELRRLVPTAFEKQGSAKLEKAEILQMTVDHLKMLHAKGRWNHSAVAVTIVAALGWLHLLRSSAPAKPYDGSSFPTRRYLYASGQMTSARPGSGGLDALAYDPSKFAMDYHNIGFRECAAEVARYLVTVEGLDIQDPLRLRLMSHLQCFAAQRELASKQAPWYGPPGSAPPGPQVYQQSHNPLDTSGSSANSSFDTSGSCQSTPPSSAATTSSSTSALTPLTTVTSGYHQPYHQHVHNQHPYPAPYPHHQNHQNSFGHQNNSPVSSQMKPYRPWGAEVAY